jgi:hypothetical protein
MGGNISSFKTKNYRFDFTEEEKFGTCVVYVHMSPINHRVVDERDIEFFEEFFNDIGKWENFIQATINFLEDTTLHEFDEETRRKYQETFGPENYTFEIYEKEGRTLRAAVTRHPKADRERPLRMGEIAEQYQNVLKWRHLMNQLKVIKDHIL